jgi:HK97 family phage portal protein
MPVSIRGAGRAVVSWVGRTLRGWSIGSELARHLGITSQRAMSGIMVNDSSALEATSYWAGIRNVSEDLATLPLITYRRVDELRRERDPEHYLYPILHDSPNEECDSVVFVEAMQAHLMMRRNAYAEVVRDGRGRCTALWPIHPRRVTPFRFEGELFYRISLPEPDPRTGKSEQTLDRSRILHLKAMALDGVQGTSSIEQHREAIGHTLAVERYGAAFFGNDATPGGVYTVPGALSDEAYARMQAEINAGHQGVERSHRVKLLEEGTKFEASTVPNDKAQFMETRRLQIEEMARLNRVPPHTIQDLSRSTNNNIEHQGIEYVQFSIRTWAARWEKAIFTQVMLAEDRRTHYAEFLLDALLRGDAKSQADALNVMRQNGVINADEWRKLKNMNPIEDGSGALYLVNGNMIPVAQAGNPQQVKTEPGGVAPARMLAAIFRATAERLLRKESVAVGKAAERLLPGDLRGFEAWATTFYGQQAETMRQAFAPLAVAVGEAVRGETGPDMSDWALEHAAARAAARGRAAVDEIRAVVAQNTTDVGGAVRALADGWGIGSAAERMAERELRAAIEGAERQVRRLAA